MIYGLYLTNIVFILLGICFQVLFVQKLGATSYTDCFYLALTIVDFSSLTVLGFITDLYMQIYNDIRVKSESEAMYFINAVLMLVLVTGGIISIVLFFSAPIIVNVFASGFSETKILYTAGFIKILTFSIFLSFLNSTLNYTLNARLHLLITYITNLFLPLSYLAFILVLTDSMGILSLVYAHVVGNLLIFITLSIYSLKKLEFKAVNPFKNKYIPILLKQNLPMRFGILLYLLRGPITTNVLSHFPAGTLTLYNYADRILLTLNDICCSIIMKIMYVKSCIFLSEKRFQELKNLMHSSITVNILLFLLITIPFMLFFTSIFNYFFAQTLSPEQINLTYLIFVYLLPFYVLMAVELPFTSLTMAMKKGWVLLGTALIFTIVYTLLMFIGMNALYIFAVPVAIFIGEAFNTGIYALYISKKLDIIDKNMVINISFFLGIVAIAIIVNIYNNILCIPASYVNFFIITILIIIVFKYRLFYFDCLKEHLK